MKILDTMDSKNMKVESIKLWNEEKWDALSQLKLIESSKQCKSLKSLKIAEVVEDHHTTDCTLFRKLLIDMSKS